MHLNSFEWFTMRSLLQKLFGQFRKNCKMLGYIVLSNCSVQLINACLINSFVGSCFLHDSLILLVHFEVQLKYFLIITWIIVIRNWVSLFTCIDNSVRGWLVESSGCLFQHISNVDDEMPWNRVNINPLVVNVFSLKSPLSSHQHSQKSIITVLPKRLSLFFILLRDFRVMEKNHKSIVISAEWLTEKWSL